MNIKPLITVIVPVYKVEDTLKRCVDSILGQTYPNIEIILVDDGSPDNCGILCDEFAKNHTNIKVIHQKNMGLSMARNNGLKIASGKYIGFVDSDDQIEPLMYEEMLKLMLDENLKVVESPQKQGGKIIYKPSGNNKIVQTLDEALHRKNDKGFNNVTNKLYAFDLINDLTFRKGKLYEDIIYTSEVWQKIDKIGFIQTSYYNYSIDGESIQRSSYNNAKIEGLWVINEAFDNLSKLVKSSSSLEIIRQKRLRTLLFHFHELLQNQNLDPEGENLKSMRLMIKKNSKFTFNNFYFTLINILPIPIYKIFFKVNSIRIKLQKSLIR